MLHSPNPSPEKRKRARRKKLKLRRKILKETENINNSEQAASTSKRLDRLGRKNNKKSGLILDVRFNLNADTKSSNIGKNEMQQKKQWKTIQNIKNLTSTEISKNYGKEKVKEIIQKMGNCI